MDIIGILNEARNEIQRLRRENELLGAKVEVMDSFMCVLHTVPAQSLRGASPDIAWRITEKIEEIQQQEAP